MHALSYADQLYLLEHLVAILNQEDAPEDQLLRQARAWVGLLPPGRSFNSQLRRDVETLCAGLRQPPLRETARAGLLYLLRAGGDNPAGLTELALQAHAFMVSALARRMQRAAGQPVEEPRALSPLDRQRAEAVFTELLGAPRQSDADLAARVHKLAQSASAGDGRAITEEEPVFFRRLLRNAEFLLTVLESPDAEPEHRDYARAALGYLAMQDDAIDDQLQILGYLDDAWVLDTAVSFIEPARQSWMHLVEATSTAWSLLAEALVRYPDEAPVPLSRGVLMDAALLSEPLAGAPGPLSSALVVPASGSTPILLGVAAALGMLQEQVGAAPTGRGAASRIQRLLARAEIGQFVVIAAPLKRARKLVETILWEDKPLRALLPVAVHEADGSLTTWSTSGIEQPLLVFVPTLADAARLLNAEPRRVRLVLLDLEAATAGLQDLQSVAAERAEAEAAEPAEPGQDALLQPEAPAPAARKPAARKAKPAAEAKAPRKPRAASADTPARSYETEIRDATPLTADEEIARSLQMQAGRAQMAAALERFPPALLQAAAPEPVVTVVVAAGARTPTADPTPEIEPEEGDELAAPEPDAEVDALVAEDGAEDEPEADVDLTDSSEPQDNDYRRIIDHVRPLAERARALRRGGASSAPADLAAFESQAQMSLDGFLAAWDELEAGWRQVEIAVEDLIRSNLRLVVWMARKYRSNERFFADIIHEGNIGLMRAARRFDHRKGARFGTYASWWIRQGIEHYLSQHSRTIRIPTATLHALRQMRSSRQTLELQLGREPTLQEISDHCDMPLAKVRKLSRMAHDLESGCLSIDEPLGEESGGALLQDVIADPDAPQPVEAISAQEMSEEVYRLLETLKPIEAEVLRMRFGLGEHEHHTLAAIGEQLGLTRERIRQIELRALGKLRFQAKHLGVRS